MEKTLFAVKTSAGNFCCPLCGDRVKPGEVYVDVDSVKTCFCVMPVRNLIPVKRIGEMEGLIRHLELKNLHLRMDISVLASFPDGAAASKIRERYRKAREELLLTAKN